MSVGGFLPDPDSPPRSGFSKRKLPATLRRFVNWVQLKTQQKTGTISSSNPSDLIPGCSFGEGGLYNDFGGQTSKHEPATPWRCFALAGGVLFVFFFTWFCLLGGGGDSDLSSANLVEVGANGKRKTYGSSSGAASETALDGEIMSESEGLVLSASPRQIYAAPAPRIGRPVIPEGYKEQLFLNSVRADMSRIWRITNEPIMKLSLLDAVWAFDMRAEWQDAKLTMIPPPTFGASNNKAGNGIIGDAMVSIVSAYAMSNHAFCWQLADEYVGRALSVYKSESGYPPLAMNFRSGERTIRKGASPINEISELAMGFLSAGLLLHGENAFLSEAWLRSLYTLSGLTETHMQKEVEVMPSLYELLPSKNVMEWKSISPPKQNESSKKVLKFYLKSATFDRLSFAYYDFLLKGSLFLRDAWVAPGDLMNGPGLWTKLFVKSVKALKRDRLKVASDGQMLLIDHKGDMLYDSCQFGSLFILGASKLKDAITPREREDWLNTAKGVAETCHTMFKANCAASAQIDPLTSKVRLIPSKTAKEHCVNYEMPAEAWFHLYLHTGDVRYKMWLQDMFQQEGLRRTPKMLRFAYFSHLPFGSDLFEYVKNSVVLKSGQLIRPPMTGMAAKSNARKIFDQRRPAPESDTVDDIHSDFSSPGRDAITNTTDDSSMLQNYRVGGLPARSGPSVFKKQRHRPWVAYPVEPLFAEGRQKFMSKAHTAYTTNFLEEAEDWTSGRKKWDANEIIDKDFIDSLTNGAATSKEKARMAAAAEEARNKDMRATIANRGAAV
ncbi:unnamed protein product [Amoebophrya sp. A120]|nr:unnamed protein product [Amoebophrya sp. A120]|eukprot:GSA120T00019447001.1